MLIITKYSPASPVYRFTMLPVQGRSVVNQISKHTNNGLLLTRTCLRPWRWTWRIDKELKDICIEEILCWQQTLTVFNKMWELVLADFVANTCNRSSQAMFNVHVMSRQCDDFSGEHTHRKSELTSTDRYLAEISSGDDKCTHSLQGSHWSGVWWQRSPHHTPHRSDCDPVYCNKLWLAPSHWLLIALQIAKRQCVWCHSRHYVDFCTPVWYY